MVRATHHRLPEDQKEDQKDTAAGPKVIIAATHGPRSWDKTRPL